MTFGGRESTVLGRCQHREGASSHPQLSAPELKASVDSGTPFELIDVRTEDERALERIDGSRLFDQKSTSGVRDSAIFTICGAASTPGVTRSRIRR